MAATPKENTVLKFTRAGDSKRYAKFACPEDQSQVVGTLYLDKTLASTLGDVVEVEVRAPKS